jgi:hypothetical protein
MELGFFGHRVSAAGVAIFPHKVPAAREWPIPSSNVDLSRFIKLCNYYRRFIDRCADIAAQLVVTWPSTKQVSIYFSPAGWTRSRSFALMSNTSQKT